MRIAPVPLPERPRVLVVDDEPEIRELLESVLVRRGYRVTQHGDGTQALEEVRGGDVALLITDLRMPGMGGLSLIEAAKGLRPELASIVITAYASTETAVEALRHGVDDFVTKPFDMPDLCRTVERVLAARRLVTSDQDALDRVRREADDLRKHQRSTADALADARRHLDDSRRDRDRRVADLTFLADFTALLAKESALEPLLERTARILRRRFEAGVVRLEVALPDGVHVTEHAEPGFRAGPLATTARDLVRRARLAPEGVVSEVHLATGRPLEALAAPLDLATGPAGGILMLRTAEGDDDRGAPPLLALVPRALGVALEAEVQRREAVASTLQIATGMLEALESRGTLHRGHADRVARLSVGMADALGRSARFRRVLENAARLHDVGAVGVPDALLGRPGPLAPHERDLLRSLPMLGARILAPFGEAALYVRHLHERPDGAGYPDGLRGDAIPLGSAIIGCAEAYDAMTHHRAWRPSRSRDEALCEMDRLRGIQFLPRAVDALRQVVEGSDG